MYQSREDLRLVLHHPMGFLLEFSTTALKLTPYPLLFFFAIVSILAPVARVPMKVVHGFLFGSVGICLSMK